MTSLGPPSRRSSERAVDAALWVLTVGCVGLILWLSLGVAPPGTDAFSGADKVLHGLAYFVTTLLFLFAAVWRPGRGPGPLAGHVTLVAVTAIGAGLLVEVLQGALTSERQLELADWLAEIVGVLAALAVHRLVRRLSPSVVANTEPPVS